MEFERVGMVRCGRGIVAYSGPEVLAVELASSAWPLVPCTSYRCGSVVWSWKAHGSKMLREEEVDSVHASVDVSYHVREVSIRD